MDKDFIKNIASQGAKKPSMCPKIQLFLWAMVMVLYTLLLVSYFGLRADFAAMVMQPVFVAEIALVLATSLTAAIASSFLSLPDGNQNKYITKLPLICLALLSLLIFSHYMMTKDVHLEQLCGVENYQCAMAVVFFAIVPSIIFFIILFNGASTNHIASGFMIGLSAGSFSYFLLRIIHATQDIAHLFLWHSLPILIVVLVSVLTARFVVPKL